MKRDEFARFKATAIKEGINAVAWAGFVWINLTDSQMNQMCAVADKQGLKQNEDGWYQLSNGLRFRR